MIAAEIELIEDTASLEVLAPEWDALWRRVPTRTPFQSPAWLLPWWRQFGTPRPMVAVLRDNDRLVGILPLYVLAEAGGSKLLPIGVGLSDYFDALIAPDAPERVAAILLATILAACTNSSVCDLLDVPPSASLFAAASPRGWQAIVSDGETCPVLFLPIGAAGIADIVPAKTRRKLRMNRHRAERVGGWTTHAATASTLADSLDALIRFHQSRWTSRGETGVFADDRVERHHREAAPLLLDAGVLKLMTLHIESTIAAACMAFLAPPDRLMFYLSGFDEGFASLSPGTLLLGDMIEEAIRNGVREVHFLRGGEAYKYAWGGVDRRNINRHLTRRR